MNPRVSLQTVLAFALVCAAVLGCGRPAPPAPAPTPLPVAAPVAAAPPAEPREPKPYETPRPPVSREATPWPDLREAAPGEPAPKAGHQVQRCTEKGRTIYVDLNVICAEGPGERVTVFPTEGVGAAR